MLLINISNVGLFWIYVRQSQHFYSDWYLNGTFYFIKYDYDDFDHPNRQKQKYFRRYSIYKRYTFNLIVKINSCLANEKSFYTIRGLCRTNRPLLPSTSQIVSLDT